MPLKRDNYGTFRNWGALILEKKLRLELEVYETLIAKDPAYEVIHTKNYVDLETGKIIILYEDDLLAEADAGIEPAENQEKKNLVSSNSKRFLKLPEISHGEQHQILHGFIYSNWTDDKELKEKALFQYDNSFGRWMKAIELDLDILNAWYDYKRNYIEKYTLNFFRKSIKNLGLEIIEENGDFFIII